jgi:hypothetical protein
MGKPLGSHIVGSKYLNQPDIPSYDRGAHQKSSARNVTHMSAIPVLGSFTEIKCWECHPYERYSGLRQLHLIDSVVSGDGLVL